MPRDMSGARLAVGLALKVQAKYSGLAFGLGLQGAVRDSLKLELSPVRRVLPPQGDRWLANIERASDRCLTAEVLNGVCCAHKPFYNHTYR